jgi:hypothetical protein
LLARDRKDRRILEAPDLGSAEENAYRARLLGEWRGYGRNADVFTDLPEDTCWFRAVLESADHECLKYINDDYWTDFSGGSRLVRDAAARIRDGAIEPGEAACYRRFADDLAAGVRFVEPILLYNPGTDELVVMEGHIRLTSYLLWVQTGPGEQADLPVIVGVSEQMCK